MATLAPRRRLRREGHDDGEGQTGHEDHKENTLVILVTFVAIPLVIIVAIMCVPIVAIVPRPRCGRARSVSLFVARVQAATAQARPLEGV